MPSSDNLGFSLLSTGQSQKEVTTNTALKLIDAVLNTSVLDKDLTAPPSAPTTGDLYIVASVATGAWSGQEGKVAWYDVNTWTFITPNEGIGIWVADEDVVYYYDGAAWVSTPDEIQNIPLLGVNTTADATNKLAVGSSAILFNNIGNGVQVKLNKNAAGDTASFLFQTAFAGFAEFGTTGDDDFHFKVTPDNFSTTYEAMVIDKDDGWTRFLGIHTVASTTLTIATGAITATQTPHKIDTESASSTDDLDTISGGVEGKIVIIEPANDARTVVVKNAVGNIRNSSGADVSLDAYGQSWVGRFDGTNWIQIGGKA